MNLFISDLENKNEKNFKKFSISVNQMISLIKEIIKNLRILESNNLKVQPLRESRNMELKIQRFRNPRILRHRYLLILTIRG